MAAREGPPGLVREVTRDDLDALVAQLSAELPGFRVAFKDESRVHRWVARLMRPWNPTYLTEYATVFRRTVWVPSRAWYDTASPAAMILLLRHEAVHLRDMRRFPVFFELSYALLLPAGLTFRAYWELRAYDESVRALVEMTGGVDPEWLDRVVEQFAGPAYLYMLPFRGWVRRHFERVADEAARR